MKIASVFEVLGLSAKAGQIYLSGHIWSAGNLLTRPYQRGNIQRLAITTDEFGQLSSNVFFLSAYKNAKDKKKIRNLRSK